MMLRQQAGAGVLIHNALYWLEEFNLDGLRFDAAHPSSTRARSISLTNSSSARTPWPPSNPSVTGKRGERCVPARPSGLRSAHYTAQWNDDCIMCCTCRHP